MFSPARAAIRVRARGGGVVQQFIHLMGQPRPPTSTLFARHFQRLQPRLPFMSTTTKKNDAPLAMDESTLGPDPESVPSPDPYSNAATGHALALYAQLARDPTPLTAANADGWPLLYLAARYGRDRVARVLMRLGADPRACCSNNASTGPPPAIAGKSAADVARFWGHDSTAALLDPVPSSSSTEAATSNAYRRRLVRAGPHWGPGSVPHMTFAGPGAGSPPMLDRAATLRDRADTLDAMYRDPRVRVLGVLGSNVLLSSRVRTDSEAGSSAAAVGGGADPVRYLTRDELVKAAGARFANYPPKANSNGLETAELSPPPVMVFLGVDPSDAQRPYFGLDLLASGVFADMAAALVAVPDAKASDLRGAAGRLTAMGTPAAMASAAWLAEARSLLDWHMRNRHCAYCGAPTTHVEGGWRRSCPNAPDATTNPKGTCLAGVQNYAHPRTDPVAMACAVHPLGNALLLGRSPGWPTGMYSCTAGFIEPGETIEAAARREVAEETGVDVGAVEYIASQPWPMPNSLMIGCMAQATSEDIVLRDHELEHAAWFTTAQVADMVAKSDTMFNSGQTHTVRSDPTAAVAVTGANFIPGRMSIAGLLIREWLYQWSEMAADLIPPTPPGGRRAHM